MGVNPFHGRARSDGQRRVQGALWVCEFVPSYQPRLKVGALNNARYPSEPEAIRRLVELGLKVKR
jgi:hypothetical protein